MATKKPVAKKAAKKVAKKAAKKVAKKAATKKAVKKAVAKKGTKTPGNKSSKKPAVKKTKAAKTAAIVGVPGCPECEQLGLVAPVDHEAVYGDMPHIDDVQDEAQVEEYPGHDAEYNDPDSSVVDENQEQLADTNS